jgi:hypothetical protein
MALRMKCHHQSCEKEVEIDGSVGGAGGAALKVKENSEPRREAVYLECADGHVEEYEVEIHPDGSITAL